MDTMINRCFRAYAVFLLLWAATGAQAGTIVGSKHDLSINAGVQICVYCHTPHNASTQADLLEFAPLWNRKITNLDAFTPYTSATMTQVCPQRPSGISLACLSCHDGTQAGSSPANSAVYGGDQHGMLNTPIGGGPVNLGSDYYGAKCTKCHFIAGDTYSKALTVMAGPNLKNDHPISMTYPIANLNFNTPPNAANGWADVKLYSGKVECSTCHSVHDPSNPPFLRAADIGSALCLRCHIK